MSIKYSLLTVSLLIMLSLCWWFANKLVEKNLIPSAAQSDQPDIFISGVSYFETDKNGELYNTLFSQKIVHYPKKDQYVFSHPEIKISSKKYLWHITSLHGESEDKAHTIRLSGKVYIKRLTNDGFKPTLTLKTKALTLYPYKKWAETKEALIIDRPGSLVKAVGATADFDKGILQLLSRIEGEYLP